MATDLIKRAAAICGYPFTPNSDQLAAWLDSKRVDVCLDSFHRERHSEWAASIDLGRADEWNSCEPYATMLEALAAAVVEVDRIERDAKKP